jgi:hypothetical protein
MPVTQPASVVNPGDLFTALQNVNETTQAQIVSFHRHMALVKALAGQLRGEAQLQLLGDVSISLHRVHTLLFGGVVPESAEPAAAQPGAGGIASAMDEFSALLNASRETARQVGALLAQTEDHLGLLQAASEAVV